MTRKESKSTKDTPIYSDHNRRVGQEADAGYESSGLPPAESQQRAKAAVNPVRASKNSKQKKH